MKKKLTWKDLKEIIELKTFYIVLFLALLGFVLLLVEVFCISKDNFLHGILSSFGITFISSSTVSLIMEIFLRFDIVDFMSNRLLSVMPENITGNAGVNEFYLDRKRIDFKSKWNDSEQILKIIGVSSNDILASANFPLIKKKLEMDKTFNIQILLLCPWSITAELRSEASVYKTKYEGIIKTYSVILDIENFFEQIKECGIDRNRFRLKLYDDIPSLSMVIDYKEAIVAPFMVVEQGGSSPYYIAKNLHTANCIYNLYCKHFDAIWKNAFEINENITIEDIFELQKKNDTMRIDNLSESYEDWILRINKVNRK